MNPQDCYNGTFEILTSEKIPQLKTTSRQEEFLTGNVTGSSIAKSGGSSDDGDQKIFEIASITKTFAAVTLAKMMADEKYAKFFDKEDPMGTSLASFEKLIAESPHIHENIKKYFAEIKKIHPRYKEITLRSLLNHSSGIIDNVFDNIDGDRKSLDRPHHLSDEYRKPKIEDDKFGKMCYSNPPFDNLLAPIMEAISSDVDGKKIKFSQIVKKQIIDPLELKNTFMGDEMAISGGGSVIVQGRSEISVAKSHDFYDGKENIAGKSFNFDIASGGMYSSAGDVVKFYESILGNALLDEKASHIFFDDKNFIPSDAANNTDKKTVEFYGLGIRKITFGETEYFHHGGAALGGYSHAIAQRNIGGGDVKAACIIISYDNLIRPIAAAILGEEKKDEKGNFFVDDSLIKKMEELKNTHTKETLLEMRRELDSIDQSFDTKSKSFKQIYEKKYQTKTLVAALDLAIPNHSVKEPAVSSLIVALDLADHKQH
jgi:CubicO group peptidase (beta-lactamase class C family)